MVMTLVYLCIQSCGAVVATCKGVITITAATSAQLLLQLDSLFLLYEAAAADVTAVTAA
jgi:hypothetical protein